jgi:hypothetical protein
MCCEFYKPCGNVFCDITNIKYFAVISREKCGIPQKYSSFLIDSRNAFLLIKFTLTETEVNCVGGKKKYEKAV